MTFTDESQFVTSNWTTEHETQKIKFGHWNGSLQTNAMKYI